MVPSGLECPLENTSIAVSNSAVVQSTTRITHHDHHFSTDPKTMMKLTGIKAFEARWQTLKGDHTPSATENRLLMQSMGRLVDNYASQDELINELPETLQGSFNHLVDAYLNGCWVDDEVAKPSVRRLTFHPSTSPVVSPAMLAAQQLRKNRRQQPTPASEAPTYVVQDRRCSLYSA